MNKLAKLREAHKNLPRIEPKSCEELSMSCTDEGVLIITKRTKDKLFTIPLEDDYCALLFKYLKELGFE